MKRVLVANRGEIALRIIRACFDEGLEAVIPVSDVDRDSLPAATADRAVVIGPGPAAESYLSIDRLLAAARMTDCDAVHPGYGFLSERPEFAQAVAAEGLTFIGPPSAVMLRSGDKLQARETAASIGIPVGRGSAPLASVEEACDAANEIGFPVMLKASAGGGGRGMAILHDEDDTRARFESSSVEAERAFGDGRLYVERYVSRARHIEVQVIADDHGNVVHLGERDCSCQRRYQKVIEEAPATGLTSRLVDEMRDAAVALARHLEYRNAGTVEFLVDTVQESFVFLEINARVQVEHPVTEVVTGVDIVREQLRVAQGHALSFSQDDVRFRGHAIECRINAEDPANGFLPSPGTITHWVTPTATGVRVDSHGERGASVPPYYDSLLAKVITFGNDREAALRLIERYLIRMRIDGVHTTIPLVRAIVGDERFARKPITTRWLEEEFMPSWEQETAR